MTHWEHYLREEGFDKDKVITTYNSEEWIEFGIFTFPKKDETTFMEDALKIYAILEKANDSENHNPVYPLENQMIGYKYINFSNKWYSFNVIRDCDILDFYYRYSKDKSIVLSKLNEFQKRLEAFKEANPGNNLWTRGMQDLVIEVLTAHPRLISTFSKNNIDAYKIKDFVIKHKDLFSYNDLPKCLSDDKKLKEVFNVLISFENGFEPKTEDDYKTILDAYLKSDYTIDQFCDNYKIKEHDGFKNFLNKMARENEEYAEQIRQKGIESQKKYIIKILDLSKKLANGELSIEDVINNSSSEYLTLNRIIVTIEKTNPNEASDILHRIAVQLRDYIKANPYTLKIRYLSSFIGKQNLNYEKMPKQTALSEEIKKFFTKYGYMLDKNEGMKGYYEAADIVRTYCQIYNPHKDILFTSMMVDGKMVEVTQNHIDQLVAFLDLNKLSRTKNVANYFLKEIVKGNIDYSYKIAEHKEKHENNKKFNEALSECTSAKEYFGLIDNRKKRY